MIFDLVTPPNKDFFFYYRQKLRNPETKNRFKKSLFFQKLFGFEEPKFAGAFIKHILTYSTELG